MRTRARDTTALAAGSALSGLLAYVFFALTTRALGPVDAAPVSVLWTYWSFAAAALTFPLQHWIVRSVAANDGEGAVRGALPRVLAVVVGATVLTVAVSWLVREELFRRDDLWFPTLIGVVTLGSAFIGIVRGALAARHRFVSVSWALVAENGLRCVAALGLMLASVRASVGYGLCLVAGQLVGLLWPSSVRFARGGRSAVHESPMTFLTGAAGGQLISQAVLTGGPVLLALSGGTAAEVTALFAGLALFRAPYTLALGLVSQLTGRLTLLVLEGRRATLGRVRLAILVVTAVGTVLAAAVGAWAGPPLIKLVFGPGIELDATVSMLVAVGSGLALSNLVLTIMIMAKHRTGGVLRAWVVGSVVAGVVYFVAQTLTTQPAALEQSVWVFLAAEASAFVALLVEDVISAAAVADKMET
jgi:O-antigen/teichoic acid export membrane protein